MKKYPKGFGDLFLVAAFIAGTFCAAGCDQKEKVLDIETPGRSLEIERSTETGDVDVEISNE